MSGTSSAGRGTTGVAAGKAGTTAFGTAAETAGKAEEKGEDNERSNGDADDCWPSGMKSAAATDWR